MANHVQPNNFMGVELGVTEVHLGHADLVAAAVSETLTIAALLNARGFSVPANAELISGVLSIHTDFSGGAVATCTLSLGDAGAPTELLSAENIFTGAKAAQALSVTTLATPQFESAAYVPQIVVTTTVGNVADLTAGSCTVRIVWRSHDPASRV